MANCSNDIPDRHLWSCSWCVQTDGCLQLLPCLHTVCYTCLQKHEANDNIEPGSDLTCQFCGQSTRLPEDGQTQFPMKSLQFLHKPKEQVFCDICRSGQYTTEADSGYKSASKAAESKCIDCDELLCEDCSRSHQHAKLTCTHVIKSLNDINKNFVSCGELRRKLHFQICPDHPTERLKYYCTDCKIVICCDCKVLEHDLHPCKMLQEATSECDTALSDLFSTLSTRTADKKSQLDEVTSTQKQLSDNFEIVWSDIQKHTENVVKDLHTQCEYLQNNCTDSYTKYFDDLISKRAPIEKNLEHLKKLHNLLANLQTVKCDVTKLELGQHVCQQYQQYLSSSPSDTHSVVYVDSKLVEFVPNKSIMKKQIGMVDSTSQHYASLSQVSVKSTSVALEVIESFSGKTKFDVTNPWLSGVTVHNDTVIAVDYENKNIKCFDSSGTFTHQFQPVQDVSNPGRPRNITMCMNLAVLKYSQGRIMLFDGEGKYLSYSYGFRSALGLATTPDSAVLYYDKPEQSIFAFTLQDHPLVKNIRDMRRSLFKTPVDVQPVGYMACNIKGIIAAVDPVSVSVFFLDLKGKLLLRYNPETLKGPAGVCADKQGNYYIADTLGNCIHTVDHTLTRMEVLGEEADLHGPLALTYHQKLDSIVVTQTDGQIKILRIN